MGQSMAFYLKDLPNGHEFKLPDGRVAGKKIYGNDCRVRVNLAGKVVSIGDKTPFSTTNNTDWSPYTEVVPLTNDEEVKLDPATGELI